MKKLLLLLSISVTGCTHSIHMSHMSDVSANTPTALNLDKHIVEVNTEQRVILGFAFDTDYVNQAYQALQKKCPSEIVAVNTQYSTSHGFLHWTNKIRMKAVCAS
jgi:hypothetical protein